jgi:hypothetical protein
MPQLLSSQVFGRGAPRRLCAAASTTAEAAGDAVASRSAWSVSSVSSVSSSCSDIVRFERYMETTPDPRTGKLRHPNTVAGYLSSFKGVFTVAVQQIFLGASPMDKVTIGSKD